MWQPTADLLTLQKRAKLLSDCRSFFSARGVLETDVPVLGATGVSDPNIECFQVENFSLQSSPEYFMKRLLAAGSGDIYCLGKAFRKEEAGAKHSPEFTLLEWYRLGYDDRQLACEVVDLLSFVAGERLADCIRSYEDVFLAASGLNPHTATAEELANCARAHLDIHFDLPHKSAWLDLLFTHLVEPNFGRDLYVIHDFPACQAALARTVQTANGYTIARRFEVYWCGLELANGYWELCDPEEQRRRFAQDLQLRTESGKILPVIDEHLLAALEAGLPPCAGVALGIDRLLMCLSGQTDIRAVQAFSPLG